MLFTPRDARLQQLKAAEELLCLIEPSKAYPIEFVVFKITGYHPRTPLAGDGLLTGMALQHDLGILIEAASQSLDLLAAEQSEPVLLIDDVCEQFNCTSKTIQRWRRKGLAARRFTFADGKRRVGFMLSSVERFLATHNDHPAMAGITPSLDLRAQVDLAARFRRLAEDGCTLDLITRRLARVAGRSPLAILHTLKKHDAENPADAVLALAAAVVADRDRMAILKAARRGIALRRIARRYRRPRSVIYHIIVQERAHRLLKRRVRFIDDPLYHQPEAVSVIRQIVAAADTAAENRPRDERVPRDLPPYLQDLWRIRLLTAARERALFLQFNLRKQMFVHAKRKLDLEFARNRELGTLDRYLRSAIEVRNMIATANLRLVVSVARKHLRPGVALTDLVSEGNITLMRAVDGFDIHKGTRFSTYATLALMKGFARAVPQLLADRGRGIGGDSPILPDLADIRQPAVERQAMQRDEVRHLLSQLEPGERSALATWFGIDLGDPADRRELLAGDSGVFVAEAGELSPQRLRKIGQSAIAKLRASLGKN